jgi:hypothetical protein
MFDEPQSVFLGGVVPLELLIARSATAAVAVRSIVAYPDGFEFVLSAWMRRPVRQRRRGRMYRPLLIDPMDLDGDGEIPDEFLRFGFEFPDGARVTNVDAGPWEMSPDATEPMHGMESHSGGGSDSHYEQTFWAWPIPSLGKLTIVCEWPAHNIVETRVEVESSLIGDAAARAVPVWPDMTDRATHQTRWQMFRAVRRDDAE